MIDTKTQILHLSSEIENCRNAIRRQKESISVLHANRMRLIETLTPEERRYVLQEWKKVKDIYPKDGDLRKSLYDRKYNG